jgi:formylglycine-generating enzyme required for sulfatase activity
MNGAAAMRLAQGGMLALILFGVFAVRSESARAMDNDCDGVEVFRSNTSAEPHCIHPGTGAKEWFKDCSECPEMVLVPAGRFMMGSEKDNNEKPVHRVTIAKPFAVESILLLGPNLRPSSIVLATKSRVIVLL